MACKECLRFEKRDGALDFIYRDELVKIYEDERGQLIAIYRECGSPPPNHQQWIELKLKVWANKRWNKEWNMRYDNSQHPTWIAQPLNRSLPRRYKSTSALPGVWGSIKEG